MPSTLTPRKEMINLLIEDSVASALSESPSFWLREIFENGFVGYRQLSDQQLQMEIQLRGLDASVDTSPEISDEDAEDEFAFDLAHI